MPTGKEQRMTSLEIAEVTGKSHKNVMQSIRNMEPAWKKVNGLKFQLVDYKDKKGELRPCYSLTKTECLYVATKFNDEARAKLVLRWKQLEEEKLKAEMQPMTDLEIMRKADYADEVLDSVDCLTMTQVAKGLGMTVHDLTTRLLQDSIIYEQSGQYMLYAPYARRGLATCRTHTHRDLFGTVRTRTYLVWTEKGKQFIHQLFKQD